MPYVLVTKQINHFSVDFKHKLLKLSGNREVKLILSEAGLGVSKEQLLAIYEFATAEKFSPLVIDIEGTKDNRFRKGLLEIIGVRD